MAFDAGAVLVKIRGDLTDYKSAINEAQDMGKKLGQSLKPVGAALTAVGVAGTAAITGLVRAAAQQETSEKRLETLTRQTTDATNEQIDALKAQASALQTVGVVGDEVTMFGQSQLATFALQTESIEQLTPAMLDMVVATKGVNATQEDMINIGNLVGKVMGGQVGALSRLGVTFSEAQEEVLKTGTEMERAAMLSEVLGQNFGGLNEAMRETTEGQLAALKNDFGDLLEIMGQTFLPMIRDIVAQIQPFIIRLQEWVTANPELASTIAKIVAVVTALSLVLGPILLLIGPLVTGIQIAAGAFAVLMGPVGLVIAAIVALIAIVVLMIKHWDKVKEVVGFVWGTIVDFFANMLSVVQGFFTTFIDMFTTGLEAWWALIQFVVQTIVDYFTMQFNLIKSGLELFWTGIKLLFEFYFNLLKTAWTLFFQGVKLVADTYIGLVKAGIELFWSGLQALWEVGIAFLEGGWSGLWDSIVSVLTTAAETIKAVVKQTFNWVLEKINDIIDRINSIASKINLPGVSIPTIPNIPLLARGGNIMGGGAAIVGENGPELLELPSGARVSPLEGDGGAAATINIINPTVRSDDDLRRMREDTQRAIELARNGMTV